MNRARLIDLLTEKENNDISATCFRVRTDILFKDLSVAKLNLIGLFIIRNHYNGKVPSCIISAETIRILTERAIEKNLSTV